MRSKKTSVAMRLPASLLKKIDLICQHYEIETRTAFIEQAAELYVMYLLNETSSEYKEPVP